MDILTALHDTAPERGANRCKLQKTLDAIDDDTPGKPELLAAVESGPPASRLTLTFSALGTPVSESLICDHRAHRCYCYR